MEPTIPSPIASSSPCRRTANPDHIGQRIHQVGRALVLVALVIGAAAGTMGSVCDPGVCPCVTVDQSAAENFHVSWVLYGESHTYESGGANPGVPLDCVIDYFGDTLWEPVQGESVEMLTYVTVTCYDNHPYSFDRGFNIVIHLPDARDWQVGTMTFSSGDLPHLLVQYADPCLIDETCRSYCNNDLVDTDIVVTVEDAVGGAAPWPDVVTEDFLRVWTVELALPDPVRGQYSIEGGDCQDTLAATAFARLQLDAHMFTYHPDETCP